MKRIVLFSTPTPSNLNRLFSEIFPEEIKTKTLAYMPSNGGNISQKYVDEWEGYAKKHNADFILINNSKVNSQKEYNNLLKSNILVITGGNTFKLLDNLRKSGLDKAVKEFTKKDEFILAGFSAGALVLTPTIEVCNLPNYDENLVGLEDLTGLGIVNFEVFPHYDEFEQEALLDKYRQTAKHEVKEITNEDLITINI